MREVLSQEEKETDGLWIWELYVSVATKCIFYVPLFIWCHLLILRGNILFNCKEYTVTYRPIARQRLGKHIPAGANAHKIESLLLGNGWVNKPSQQERVCVSPWSVPRSNKGKRRSFELVVVRSWESSVEEDFEWVVKSWVSSEDDSPRRSGRNSNKGIRLWK
jgi:hypothetical protein